MQAFGKNQWTLISPVNWLCLCLGPFEVLDGVQVLAVVLWRCNLKPIEFSKNFPIDFGALQTRPESLVTADVPTCLLFLSSTPRTCLTCRDSPRCDTLCLPGLSDKIFQVIHQQPCKLESALTYKNDASANFCTFTCQLNAALGLVP